MAGGVKVFAMLVGESLRHGVVVGVVVGVADRHQRAAEQTAHQTVHQRVKVTECAPQQRVVHAVVD